MNVLHLSSERTWRGGEQQIAYLIDELSSKGVRNFVAVRKKSAFEKYCLEKKIPVFSLPFKNELDLYSAWKIKKICNQQKIDLIHIHSSHSHGIAVWSALLGNTSPMVLSRKVDFPVSNNWFSIAKYNYKGIRKIICVSEKVKEILTESIKDKSKCVTVYDGIDLSRFGKSVRTNKLRYELNIPESAFLIGNISAIAPHKDYYTFVKTAEECLNRIPTLYFTIIGNGPLYSEIKEFINSRGLSEKIIMTGFRSDITEIMADLDLFLMTSETEGLGTTVLDAMSCRIPVVATKAGGIPEVIKDRVSGLLAPVKDYKKLADLIEEISKDETLRNSIKSGASERVEFFSKERMAQSTLLIYNDVIKKPLKRGFFG